jgi:hypothetical protein
MNRERDRAVFMGSGYSLWVLHCFLSLKFPFLLLLQASELVASVFVVSFVAWLQLLLFYSEQ